MIKPIQMAFLLPFQVYTEWASPLVVGADIALLTLFRYTSATQDSLFIMLLCAVCG